MSKTLGISPKVYVPAFGQILVGVAFLILGLTVEGKTALATGLGTFFVGFGAPPAPVVTVGTETPTDGEPEPVITGNVATDNPNAGINLTDKPRRS